MALQGRDSRCLSRRTILACAALAALMLAATPSPAAAKKVSPRLGPVVTVTAAGNATTASGQESVATATCPKGTRALSGGFSAPLSDAAAVVVHDSYRSDDRRWTVAGRSVGDGGATTAYAHCRRAKKKPLSTATAEATVIGAPALGGATAMCPKGTRRISGGFRSSVGAGATDLFVTQTSIAGGARDWTVAGTSIQASSQVTAFAYCMKGIAGPKLHSAVVSGPASQTVPVQANSPACPKPKKKGKGKGARSGGRLSAGGFSVPGTTSGGTPIPVLEQSRIVAGLWFASILAASNAPGAFSLTSQAICF